MHDHHVVIVGGGFGGLRATRHLKGAPVHVTLIDSRNFHLFQPLLYQVATGGLSPANIATPLRSILKRQNNVQVLLAHVRDIDPARRCVILDDGEVAYDTLVLATGSHPQYFGHPEWRAQAPGLKTVEDALAIRRRILMAFEAAERETNPDRVKTLLTFVIVGAGPTGVELAGALSEIANHSLQHEFRTINPSDARIILADHGDRVLRTYDPSLSKSAEAALTRLGVELRPGASITQIDDSSVTLETDGANEVIATANVFWAAGVLASPLGKALSAATGIPADHGGRLPVEPDLSLAGHPEIFVIGDLANCSDGHGGSLPGVAQVALQEGTYVAKAIRARLAGHKAPPFHYRNLGSLATIGKSAAVLEVGKIKMSGFFAWVAWLFIHLMNLVQFENRVLVLFQWAWNYLTWNRAARLITGEGLPEE